MDADHGDLDGDGDLDLALAQEFARNLVLLNDGAGNFALAAGAVNAGNGDNEDLRLADFNGDGSLDMISVHEDDAVHALLFNNGAGIFFDNSALIPVNTTANAVEVLDVNTDGRLDILIGNAGSNSTLLQQADGTFADASAVRPIGSGTTQDLLLLDIDGDTDPDLFIANEFANAILINDGNGFFADESNARLPTVTQESREADAADVDNDGDLDVIVANVRFNTNLPSANQLLLNDGTGVFSDASAISLANVNNSGDSFTIKFVDIDLDGDPDLLVPRNNLGSGGTVEAWINDGSGQFSNAATGIFSAAPAGSAFDFEVFDANGDGNADLYICNRSGTDQLYLRQ